MDIEEDILKPNTYNALNIVLCTDDLKFIDPDSHFLHIPEQLFTKYINTINLSNVCFELYNPNNNKKIYLKKIEPSFGDFKNNILIPTWVQLFLDIQMTDHFLQLRPVPRPHLILRCKIKANNSSYIHIDIKSLLEDKINQFKCININTHFTIQNVIFTIIELIDYNNISVNWGITNNELQIDFDTPDDIKLIEKRKIITDKITLIIEHKINIIYQQINLLHNKNKTGIFNFNDFIQHKKNIQLLYHTQIDWDDIYQSVFNDLHKQYSLDTNELLFNKNILIELINHGKNTQLNYYNNNNTNNTNTTPYKLNNDFDNNYQLTLSRDDIRNARLKKFT